MPSTLPLFEATFLARLRAFCLDEDIKTELFLQIAGQATITTIAALRDQLRRAGLLTEQDDETMREISRFVGLSGKEQRRGWRDMQYRVGNFLKALKRREGALGDLSVLKRAEIEWGEKGEAGTMPVDVVRWREGRSGEVLFDVRRANGVVEVVKPDGRREWVTAKKVGRLEKGVVNRKTLRLRLCDDEGEDGVGELWARLPTEEQVYEDRRREKAEANWDDEEWDLVLDWKKCQLQAESDWLHSVTMDEDEGVISSLWPED